MLYQTELELPLDVREVLPPRALDVYRRAYNRTWRSTRGTPRERDRAAHASAWRTVKQSYVKNLDGEWVSRDGQRENGAHAAHRAEDL